ncbi:lipoyl(octanoyl) transferase LipB [Massilia sp. W12]|uniref:lipoyl(octanoyl) transferase LipB n=1 Tax=Massilia sp. W12 TaxID=3126507 RepID=UPI0030CC101D
MDAVNSKAGHAILLRELGVQDYAACYAAMQAFTAARTPETQDEIWLVEHAPVYTLGLGADHAHLLAADSKIPLVQTDRGGEITYHGPGQAVVYLLLDLRRQHRSGKLFARSLVQHIEQAVINLLQRYGIAGERKAGAPGIYLSAAHGSAPAGAKIAALGLKIKGSGCTYHGVSLNVAMDLQPFFQINPCGYAGLVTTDMQSCGIQADMPAVRRALAEELLRLL